MFYNKQCNLNQYYPVSTQNTLFKLKFTVYIYTSYKIKTLERATGYIIKGRRPSATRYLCFAVSGLHSVGCQQNQVLQTL